MRVPVGQRLSRWAMYKDLVRIVAMVPRRPPSHGAKRHVAGTLEGLTARQLQWAAWNEAYLTKVLALI